MVRFRLLPDSLLFFPLAESRRHLADNLKFNSLFLSVAD